MFHLLYEAIFAPTMRIRYRYKLFNYRDDLIKLKMDSQNISEEVFDNVLFYVNSAINRLPYLKLSLYIQAKKEFENNDVLRKKVENRMEIIKNSNNPEINRIMTGISSVTFSMFILNFGSGMLYLIPIYILWRILRKFFSIAIGAKKILQNFIFVPEKDFEKMSAAYQ